MAASEENRRTAYENREAFKRMSPGEKLGYFKDYYLKYTLLIAAVLIFVIVFLKTVLSPAPESALHVVVAGDVWLDSFDEEMKTALAGRLGVPADDIVISDDYKTEKQDDIMVLMAMLSTDEADVMILGEEMFKTFCGDGGFADLAEVVGEETLREWEPYLIRTAGPEDEGTDVTRAYGVHFSEVPGYQTITTTGADAVCGITGRSRHKAAAAEFINYIMGRK